MVTNLENLQIEKGTNQQRGLIVEIVGLPGAGKSTLFRTLVKNFQWMTGGFVPHFRDFSNVPFYFRNFFSIVPMLVGLQVKSDRLINRREVVNMLLLNGWHEVLMKKKENTDKVILIDQGPISLIGYLLNWGPQNLQTSITHGWWDKIFNHWSQNLDAIVYLDTSNATLIKRIRNRFEMDNKKVIYHVNGKSDQDANDFLVKCRDRYDQIINRLITNNHKMRVITIDSGKNSVDVIATTVISEVESLK